MATLDNREAGMTLVTGSSGYIGSHLGKRISFLGLDRDQVLNDLESFDPLSEGVQDVTTVVHLADRRFQDIHAENLKDNIRMHENFLNKVSDLPNLKRVIFSSSCSVYGFSEELITESSIVNPTSHYAESKLAVEEILKKLSLPHRICRFGTAYGWSEKMRNDLFINQLARSAAHSEHLEIYAPDAWRPYIHCQDFARTLEACLLDSWVGPQNIVTENLTKTDILKSKVFEEKPLSFSLSNIGDSRNYKIQIQNFFGSDFSQVEDGLREMVTMYARAK